MADTIHTHTHTHTHDFLARTSLLSDKDFPLETFTPKAKTQMTDLLLVEQRLARNKMIPTYKWIIPNDIRFDWMMFHKK